CRLGGGRWRGWRGRRRGRGGCGWCRGRCRDRRGGLARRLGDRAIVLEELPPRLSDGGGIGAVLLVHLLDEPRVGAERGTGGFCRRHRVRWYWGPSGSVRR